MLKPKKKTKCEPIELQNMSQGKESVPPKNQRLTLQRVKYYYAP